MFVRYQWVRNVVLLGGAGSIIAVCAGGDGETPSAPVALVDKGNAAGKAAIEVDDAVIIAAADKPVDGGKVKDAFRGRTKVKVNIYDDDGDRVADRVKVDRNRDDTWDESWTRKGGQWERGDGTVWQGGAWRRPGEAAPSTAGVVERAPAADPTEALRLEVAKVILEGRASGDKLKDYTRGRGPKFNLYDDDKDGRWDRAKADYDRDDTWDENWTRKGDTVERKDLKSGGIQLLEGGAWKAKGP